MGVSTLYSFFILVSFVFFIVRKENKKLNYLSLSMDLSLMLISYMWNKENIIVFAGILSTVLLIYLISAYLAFVKDGKKTSSISLRELTINKKGLDILFIIPALFIDSAECMIALLLVFLIIDRYLFYREYHSFL